MKYEALASVFSALALDWIKSAKIPDEIRSTSFDLMIQAALEFEAARENLLDAARLAGRG